MQRGRGTRVFPARMRLFTQDAHRSVLSKPLTPSGWPARWAEVELLGEQDSLAEKGGAGSAIHRPWIRRLIGVYWVREFRPRGCCRGGTWLLVGGQLLRQPGQAISDQLSVLVVAERADSGPGAVQVLAGAVEIADLPVAIREVEVQ